MFSQEDEVLKKVEAWKIYLIFMMYERHPKAIVDLEDVLDGWCICVCVSNESNKLLQLKWQKQHHFYCINNVILEFYFLYLLSIEK